MYACILFTFSRRHARVYCLSVKRGAFISCEQLLLLLFVFFFFVFHKACGTIDLQALLRNGRTPFSTIVWMCILYDVNTVFFFLVSLFIFFFEFRRQKPLGRIQCICTYMVSCQLLFHLSRQIEKKKKKKYYIFDFFLREKTLNGFMRIMWLERTETAGGIYADRQFKHKKVTYFKSQYCVWFCPSFLCVGDFCKRAVASHSALNQAMC